jgi:hypothetical protein
LRSSRFWINLPHEVHVKNPQAWIQSGEEEYFLYRTHWYIKARQLCEPAKIGEKISIFESPAGEGRKWSGSHEVEWEVVDTTESIRQMLRQEDSKSAIETELQGEISAFSLAKTASKLKGTLERDLRTSLTETSKTTRTITNSTKTTFSWEFPIPVRSSDRWVAASVYQRWAYDIYLAWVDYLIVRYDRPGLFGIRTERFKYPQPPQGGQKAQNWIEIGLPRFTLLFWELMPSSTSIKTESEYVQELTDPFDVEIVPLLGPLSRTDKPVVPSLYSLSNSCFPFRHKKDIRSVDDDDDRAYRRGS